MCTPQIPPSHWSRIRARRKKVNRRSLLCLPELFEMGLSPAWFLCFCPASRETGKRCPCCCCCCCCCQRLFIFLWSLMKLQAQRWIQQSKTCNTKYSTRMLTFSLCSLLSLSCLFLYTLSLQTGSGRSARPSCCAGPSARINRILR